MENIPVRDQGYYGTCYAQAAAQLVDAYRFAEGGDRSIQTSALEAAIGTYEHGFFRSTVMPKILGHEFDFEIGTPCAAVKYLSKVGSCPETLIEDPGTGFVEQLASTFREYQQARNEVATYEQKVDLLSKSVECIQCNCKSNLPNLTKALLPATSLKTILDQKNMGIFLNRMTDAACRERRIKPRADFKCQSRNFKSSEQLKEILLSRLTNLKSQPIGIAFCSKVLYDSDFKSKILFNYYDPSPSCMSHSALVIGTRKNQSTGKCEVLVRNSLGKTCDDYDPKWECNSGNIWVDLDALTRNTMQAYWIEPKSSK